MHIISIVAFIILFGIAVFLFAKNAGQIRKNINLGKDIDLSDNPTLRWKNVLLLAFGQKKMFRNIPVALLHLVVYVGFVVINVEVLEIVLDGILGTHRLFLAPLGAAYNFFINCFEVLAFLVLVSVIIFLVRRNVIKIKRFLAREMTGWPKSDATIILVVEVILMSLFLLMNAADRALQLQGVAEYHITGDFVISKYLVPLFSGMSSSTLIFIERSAWWLHIVGILAFLNYLPYSKHLHILLAFPNAYFAKLVPQGQMGNMPSVQNEVLYMMEPEKTPTDAVAPTSFGAKDVADLNWKHLLDAYTCTECGRCTAACPASQTGKLLSPRKIMMDTRDRMEVVGKNIKANGSFVPDDKTLLHDYITVEELRACTSCNACVTECPISINPLDIIYELRRSLVMEESNAPQEWNGMFSNIENNFAPWKLSPDDRDKWALEMENEIKN
jgi:heterodisulfide reductase subunit C